MGTTTTAPTPTSVLTLRCLLLAPIFRSLGIPDHNLDISGLNRRSNSRDWISPSLTPHCWRFPPFLSMSGGGQAVDKRVPKKLSTIKATDGGSLLNFPQELIGDYIGFLGPPFFTNESLHRHFLCPKFTIASAITRGFLCVLYSCQLLRL